MGSESFVKVVEDVGVCVGKVFDEVVCLIGGCGKLFRCDLSEVSFSMED